MLRLAERCKQVRTGFLKTISLLTEAARMSIHGVLKTSSEVFQGPVGTVRGTQAKNDSRKGGIELSEEIITVSQPHFFEPQNQAHGNVTGCISGAYLYIWCDGG